MPNNLIIEVPPARAPEEPPHSDKDPVAVGAFILASSAQVSFPDAEANTATINEQAARVLEVAKQRPKETRVMRQFAKMFPEYELAFAAWCLSQGREKLAMQVLGLVERGVGHPLDPLLRYELARFERFRRENGLVGEGRARMAADRFVGVDSKDDRTEAARRRLTRARARSKSLQNKLSVFGEMFLASRKPRIIP